MTNRGDKVNCSTGVMQGCPFASIAFSLVVKWLVSQFTHRGLEKKQFFMDDGLLYGTPVALKWAVDLMKSLETISGLRMKFLKMSVYAPDAASAQMCKEKLPSQLEIFEDEDMNFVYLKTPIGTKEFVESYLEKRLCRLREEISS